MQKLEIKGTGEIREAVRGEKYRIRFKYKDPNDGSWKYAPQKTINGNKAKARRELEMYKCQFEVEFNAPNSSMTLGEYARQWHDDRRAMGNLSELTLDRDEIEISLIEEQFSNVLITDVTPMLIKASLLNLKKSGKSESAIFKYWAKLSQVLKSATKEDLITINPCDKLDGIKRPRSKDRKSTHT